MPLCTRFNCYRSDEKKIGIANIKLDEKNKITINKNEYALYNKSKKYLLGGFDNDKRKQKEDSLRVYNYVRCMGDTLRTLVYRLCQKQSECFSFVLCSWNRNDRIGYFRYNPHKTKTKIQVIFKRIDDRKSDHLMHFVYDLEYWFSLYA